MTGITRRHLLLAAVAAGVCGDMAGLAVDRVLAAPGSHSPRKPFLPYSADAFYKASLIPGLPIDADLTMAKALAGASSMPGGGGAATEPAVGVVIVRVGSSAEAPRSRRTTSGASAARRL